MSYPSIRGNLVEFFTGSKWTHIGMVIKYKGDKIMEDGTYILEMARYHGMKEV